MSSRRQFAHVAQNSSSVLPAADDAFGFNPPTALELLGYFAAGFFTAMDSTV
jgi:hypothetical protein